MKNAIKDIEQLLHILCNDSLAKQNRIFPTVVCLYKTYVKYIDKNIYTTISVAETFVGNLLHSLFERFVIQKFIDRTRESLVHIKSIKMAMCHQ